MARRQIGIKYLREIDILKRLSHQAAMPLCLHNTQKFCQRAEGSPRNMPKNVTSPSLRRNVRTGRPCPYSIQHYGAQEDAEAPHSAQQRAHGAYEYRFQEVF